MRYDDWDVILFPGDSHVPIQEFKTVCHSTTECKWTAHPRRQLLTGIPSRWPPIAGIDLLHQLPAHFDTVSHLRTLMGDRREAVGDHGVPTFCTSKDSVHGSGHRRRGAGLVSSALCARLVRLHADPAQSRVLRHNIQVAAGDW